MYWFWKNIDEKIIKNNDKYNIVLADEEKRTIIFMDRKHNTPSRLFKAQDSVMFKIKIQLNLEKSSDFFTVEIFLHIVKPSDLFLPESWEPIPSKLIIL